MSSKIIKFNGKSWKVRKYRDEIIGYDRLDHITTDAIEGYYYTIDKIIQDKYTTKKLPNTLLADIILSVEGVYPYPERKRNEAKLSSDLKLATKYMKTVPAFDRHPKQEERGMSVYLGTLNDMFHCSKVKGIKGKVQFWREFLETHDSLNDALLNKKPFPISIGQFNTFGTGGVLDGVKFQAKQQNILIDHVAILTDDSEPRCSLGTCGINIDSIEKTPLSESDINLLSKLI
jgi:hypothetical protein